MQSEALSLGAVIMIGIGVVLEAMLGVPPGTLEVDLSQHFGQPRPSKNHDHVTQDQPEFQLDRQAQK